MYVLMWNMHVANDSGWQATDIDFVNVYKHCESALAKT
jgi:hypothetical protein